MLLDLMGKRKPRRMGCMGVRGAAMLTAMNQRRIFFCPWRMGIKVEVGEVGQIRAMEHWVGRTWKSKRSGSCVMGRLGRRGTCS